MVMRKFAFRHLPNTLTRTVLRTGIEIANTQAVLDGDLDEFIEASLKSGL